MKTILDISGALVFFGVAMPLFFIGAMAGIFDDQDLP